MSKREDVPVGAVVIEPRVGGLWAQFREGREDVRLHPTRARAEAAARELARLHHCDLVVLDQSGAVELHEQAANRD